MSFLTRAILKSHGLDGDRINNDASAMMQAAEAAREETGFENFGVPFCLTCEAQALGAAVSCGTSDIESMVLEPACEQGKDFTFLEVPEPASDQRMAATISAITSLKRRYPDVPVLGNVTGPVTLSTSIVEFDQYVRMLIRDKSTALAIADIALETILRFARDLAAAGADVIMVSDPTASGEILGPRSFGHFIPRYQRLFREIHLSGIKGMLHICGNIMPILGLIKDTGADGFSADSVIRPARVREGLEGTPLMGNLSTQLLASASPAAVRRAVNRLLDDGIDIVAPGCGIDRSTPLENIRAMTTTVKKRGEAEDTSGR